MPILGLKFYGPYHLTLWELAASLINSSFHCQDERKTQLIRVPSPHAPDSQFLMKVNGI